MTDIHKLRLESNKLFKSFEESIRKLEDFKIPREFYGYDPINKPNFNQPDKISVQGFKGYYSDLKAPTVKVQFNTLKTDVYKEENWYKDEIIVEAQQKEPNLFRFYCQKTKDRILKMVANSTKKGVKRKRKEERKKLMNSPTYDEAYKEFWNNTFDI